MWPPLYSRVNYSCCMILRTRSSVVLFLRETPAWRTVVYLHVNRQNTLCVAPKMVLITGCDVRKQTPGTSHLSSLWWVQNRSAAEQTKQFNEIFLKLRCKFLSPQLSPDLHETLHKFSFGLTHELWTISIHRNFFSFLFLQNRAPASTKLKSQPSHLPCA